LLLINCRREYHDFRARLPLPQSRWIRFSLHLAQRRYCLSIYHSRDNLLMSVTTTLLNEWLSSSFCGFYRCSSPITFEAFAVSPKIGSKFIAHQFLIASAYIIAGDWRFKVGHGMVNWNLCTSVDSSTAASSLGNFKLFQKGVDIWPDGWGWIDSSC